MVTLRWMTTGVLYAQVKRIHQLIFLQAGMFIVSLIIISRTNRLVHTCADWIRDLMKTTTVLLLLLSHSCFLFFYIHLADGCFLSIFSFLCLSVYLHVFIFISFAIIIEWIADLLIEHSRQPFLVRSERFHTILAIFAAVFFTVLGYAVTQSPPQVCLFQTYFVSEADLFDFLSLFLFISAV
ncbi:hypothetical protein AB6A40_011661 [Gnathostoma spinigerum]|uniref:Uncharacterized protein n=1 Tax=Gnathostoma spinigerum TaxID=75299 RepID=A0ABD6F4N8_9BILA